MMKVKTVTKINERVLVASEVDPSRVWNVTAEYEYPLRNGVRQNHGGPLTPKSLSVTLTSGLAPDKGLEIYAVITAASLDPNLSWNKTIKRTLQKGATIQVAGNDEMKAKAGQCTEGFEVSIDYNVQSVWATGAVGCLVSLFNSPCFSDFAICVGEAKIPVHKAVLAAQSPVFRRMFTSDAEEAKTARVTIRDHDEAAVRGLMAYFYLGNTDAVYEDLAAFLDLAEKYEVGPLKELVIWELRRTLSGGNVCDYAVLAETYDAKGLLDDCAKKLESLMKSGAAEVPDVEWRRLKKQHPDLALRLTDFLHTLPPPELPDEMDL